jgi:hypothetical protein
VATVSCKYSLKEAALSYAHDVSTADLILLDLPGLIHERQMRALALSTADQMGVLNDRGLDKHLLIRGPVALPTMSETASNACGPITVPFWDGKNMCQSLL